MPAIVIRTACNEFGRAFAANAVVTDLVELEARALVEAGLARYHDDRAMSMQRNDSATAWWPSQELARLHAGQAVSAGGQLLPAPAAGVVPITSVQWANPGAFNIFDGDPRLWEYNGSIYRRIGTAWVAA